MFISAYRHIRASAASKAKQSSHMWLYSIKRGRHRGACVPFDGKNLEVFAFLAFLTLLGLLLGLGCAFLLAVDNESGPGLLRVPFEAC